MTINPKTPILEPVKYAIDVKDLIFSYPSSRVRNLEIPQFRLERQKSLFLFGPSGAGKSTLLSLLSLILTPQSGNIKILNQETTSLNATQRDLFRGSHMGYIFQHLNLIPYLSVLENIVLPIRINPRRQSHLQSSSAESEAELLLQKLGIADLFKKKVHTLSAGQQQRVAAARALIGSPELIIADEPTSALDESARDRFIELLLEQTKKACSTLIFVSHDRTLSRHFDIVQDIRDLK